MEARGIEVAETVPASRKLQRADALELLRKATRVAVAKGRKLTEFSGANTTSDEAVTAMLGTTGNLRAPTLVAGDTLLVGFNEALYTEVFG
ncbi:MAG: ArsC family (seleno)protein [Gammaproteobacteria bacterium]|nr:ArsC family (seleno)protein [Gammaproteobacteria bacterium]